MSRIMRVFPRRTKATPADEWVRVGEGPGWFDECDEVHVSATFTWDLPEANRLADLWRVVAPTKIGGPAMGMRGEDFVPGLYVKPGYTITSRGCPNRCWFCDVWKRDGDIRELPIRAGWNVLDDNLLACGDNHIRTVFYMLSQQPRRPEFTGGLEAKRLKPWHVEWLRKLKPKQMFFAYDTPDDYEPLREAGKMLLDAGFTEASHALRCYVLCGYPRDTIIGAECRMRNTLYAGFTPMAMLWRDRQGNTDRGWRMFQRRWARPALIHSAREGQK